MTLSLGMGTHPAGVKVWLAIRAFLAQKGMVVTTCLPERDEFLQPLEAPAVLQQQAIPFETIGKNLRVRGAAWHQAVGDGQGRWFDRGRNAAVCARTAIG